jgi:hypothetical protein
LFSPALSTSPIHFSHYIHMHLSLVRFNALSPIEFNKTRIVPHKLSSSFNYPPTLHL